MLVHPRCVTGSGKTSFITPMSADLIFHQEDKVIIKFHKQIQLELSGLLSLAAFPKPSGNPYVWCGALMEFWSAWGWLYMAVQFHGVE